MAASEAPSDEPSSVEKAVNEQRSLVYEDDVDYWFKEVIADDERFNKITEFLFEEFGWELDEDRMVAFGFENLLYEFTGVRPTVVELGLRTEDDDTTAQITVELINDTVHRVTGSAFDFDHEAESDEDGEGPKHRYREFRLFDGDVFVHQTEDDDESFRRDFLRYRMLDRLRHPPEDVSDRDSGKPPSLVEELKRLKNELASLPEGHQLGGMSPDLIDGIDELIERLENEPSIERDIREQQTSLSSLSSDEKWCSICATAVQFGEDFVEIGGPVTVVSLIIYASGGLALPTGIGIAGFFLFASAEGSGPTFDIVSLCQRLIGRVFTRILGSEERRLRRRYRWCHKLGACSSSVPPVEREAK